MPPLEPPPRPPRPLALWRAEVELPARGAGLAVLRTRAVLLSRLLLRAARVRMGVLARPAPRPRSAPWLLPLLVSLRRPPTRPPVPVRRAVEVLATDDALAALAALAALLELRLLLALSELFVRLRTRSESSLLIATLPSTTKSILGRLGARAAPAGAGAAEAAVEAGAGAADATVSATSAAAVALAPDALVGDDDNSKRAPLRPRGGGGRREGGARATGMAASVASPTAAARLPPARCKLWSATR
jgi:hypothetical protein